jgi:serine/threonine-protein kinase HipA
VLYRDAAHVSLAPIYDVVSTLPYIRDDVPALVLSFEWYSKAWWPRTKIEEFAVQYGSLTHAEIRRMLQEAFEAVLGGVKRVRQYGREIAGFADLAGNLAKLWTGRVDAFDAEDSALKKPRRRAKS